MSVPAAFGSCLPSLETRVPGPASRVLAERLARVESRNVTYVDDAWPVFWTEARRCNVLDADGNVFLDLCSGFGAALLGHSHPSVVAAVHDQADRLVHGMGDVHPSAVKVELLERLAELSPWPETRAVLASTGSEAVEIALKTACLASGRPGVLAFEGGYHGLTLGSLATTAREEFRAPFAERLYGGVAFAPFPVVGGASVDEALATVLRMLDGGAPNGDAIGTIIVEPVQGRAGARVPRDGFMASLSEIAEAAGVVLVADEVQSGVGRCGAFLASSVVGLRPDVVCIGKALGGGLPISACLARSEVMDAWPESRGEALHTSTFLGHPLACAAAIAVLEALETEDVFGGAARLGGTLLEGLRDRLGASARVGEARGLGLLIGLELVDARRRPLAGAAVAASAAALQAGLIVLPAGDRGQVVEMTPAVALSAGQVGHAIEVMADVIEGMPA